VNPQEPLSIISIATSAQILMLPSPFPTNDTLGIVDTMHQKPTTKEEKEIREIATSNPIVQT